MRDQEQLLKIIVCGGRTFDDQAWVNHALDDLYGQVGEFVLVCGGQKRWAPDRGRWIGADYQAATWAMRRGVDYRVVPAQWDRYGRRAGMLRNQQMIDDHHPGLVVAFPGGPGTANMSSRGRQAGLVVVDLTHRCPLVTPASLRPVTTRRP